jgi:hypothetical protein
MASRLSNHCQQFAFWDFEASLPHKCGVPQQKERRIYAAAAPKK